MTSRGDTRILSRLTGSSFRSGECCFGCDRCHSVRSASETCCFGRYALIRERKITRSWSMKWEKKFFEILDELSSTLFTWKTCRSSSSIRCWHTAENVFEATLNAGEKCDLLLCMCVQLVRLSHSFVLFLSLVCHWLKHEVMHQRNTHRCRITIIDKREPLWANRSLLKAVHQRDFRPSRYRGGEATDWNCAPSSWRRTNWVRIQIFRFNWKHVSISTR